MVLLHHFFEAVDVGCHADSVAHGDHDLAGRPLGVNMRRGLNGGFDAHRWYPLSPSKSPKLFEVDTLGLDFGLDFRC